MIAKPDDIFWLTQVEVESAAEKVDRSESLQDHRTSVTERKAVWRAANRATPPLALPQTKLTQMKSKRGKRQNGETLKGVAASPGQVTAPACVVHGPEDFASMNTGDVLVAALTTPAWTPLFARAAAVVTDIGGPLSHGSIVAREYGIPAVLGTDDATKRIQSGQMITVDGSSGMVMLST
jgi:pyruvate,water dikinase